MQKKDQTKYYWMNAVLVVLDIIAVNAAYYIALYARFYGYANISVLFRQKLEIWMHFTPFYTVICIAVFALFKLYNGLWKYAGMHDFNRVLFSSVITSVIHVIAAEVFTKGFPKTYYILGTILQFFLLASIRLGYRIVLMERIKLIRQISPAENSMIIGHGNNAKRIMEYLESYKEKIYRSVCIIDDETGTRGFSLNGVPVIGGADRIEYGIEKYKVRNIFIANPLLDNAVRKQLEEICEERNLNLHDPAGYLVYQNRDDALLQIVKAPVKVNVEGVDRRIIPFSPPDISEKEIGEVTEALKSGWITTGPRTKLLERRLAAYIETGKADIDCTKEENISKYSNRVVCLNSATAAEELNLRILGVRPGDEVIVPAYTYTASASAAIHCGAKVVFVDIQKDGDPVTHMPEMDYAALEAAITENTKAIVTVDLGGIVCDYDRIFEIVERKRSLFKQLADSGDPLTALSSRIQQAIGRVAVVADCAHSLGASRVVARDGSGMLTRPERKYCGAIADFTSFSFHAVKNFTTAEGGASAWLPIPGVENSEIYKYYQLLSLHGQNKDALAKTKVGAWEYDIIGPWYKCNMTDIMAAIGLRQLDRYPRLLDRRRQIIARYDRVCDELGVFHMLHHVKGMDSSDHLYLTRIPGADETERNAVITEMAQKGVATNVHYKPLPMMTAYKAFGWDIKDFPNTYAYYENLVTLPLNTLLTDEDVEYVCRAYQDTVKKEQERTGVLKSAGA